MIGAKNVMLVFEAEIPGRCYVKKNTQRVVGFGKRKRAIYSANYLSWEATALLAFKRPRLRCDSTLTGELHASYVFHFKNKHGEADTSNLIEGVQDCLATAKIISNDKIIMSLGAQKIFDGTEKTIIRLYTIGG